MKKMLRASQRFVRQAAGGPLVAAFALLYAHTASANFIQYFKEEDGSTNWQYVANFSSSVLILLLSGLIIKLYFTHRRARKANRELQEIRDALEVRVQERTATLNESNRLLKETNQLLEKEARQHRETANRLKLSEAYIKNILESMPLMLIGITGDGRITQWNRKAEEITGIGADQAVDGNLWETYPAITVAPSQVEQAAQLNRPLTIKHSQRGRYHFDIIIYPLHKQSETSVVILVEDVTQRVSTENMLIHRDKMSAMGELASTMAHDIDVPLQAILSDVKNIQAFLDRQPPVEGNPQLEQTLEQLNTLLHDAALKGENASAIINNLLEFSRTQDGEKRPANVVDIMEKAIQLARDVIAVPGRLSFRDIELQRDYEEELPAIPCFPTELQQVFLSLFRHACQALSQADRPGLQPLITVQIMECYEALWIKISHNGRGLTLEEQKYIFEPFFNNPTDLDDPSKRLSFSYFIITEHHDGHMAVTSDLELGSTFHMQIQLD